MLGAACRYRDVASHSSFESAGRELNSPSLTQQARNTWLWVDGRSQRQACNSRECCLLLYLIAFDPLHVAFDAEAGLLGNGYRAIFDLEPLGEDVVF